MFRNFLHNSFHRHDKTWNLSSCPAWVGQTQYVKSEQDSKNISALVTLAKNLKKLYNNLMFSAYQFVLYVNLLV